MTSPVPSARLDLSGLSPAARLEAWRATTPAHEVTAHDDTAPEIDEPGLTVWHLGPILLANSRLGSLRLARRPALIRRDQIDHVAIAVGRGGSWRASGNGVGFDMAPGQVSVSDLAQPIDTDLAGATALQLVIPRDSLGGLDPGAAHGTVLSGGAAGLFADYLEALERRMPTLRSEDLAGIARVTVDLFAVGLRPTLEAMHRAHPAINMTLLQRFRRHVEQNLRDPNLTPEAIAVSLLISRARLYNLLETFGGVAAYVRTRRLARAHARLCDPGPPVPIKEIAFQVGFASETQFSRAFRGQYGCSPTEARAGESVVTTSRADPAAADILLEWLRELR